MGVWHSAASHGCLVRGGTTAGSKSGDWATHRTATVGDATAHSGSFGSAGCLAWQGESGLGVHRVRRVRWLRTTTLDAQLLAGRSGRSLQWSGMTYIVAPLVVSTFASCCIQLCLCPSLHHNICLSIYPSPISHPPPSLSQPWQLNCSTCEYHTIRRRREMELTRQWPRR